MCGSKSRIEDDLKESIQDVVSSVSKGELQHAMHSMFLRCNVCLWVEVKHFQHIL